MRKVLIFALAAVILSPLAWANNDHHHAPTTTTAVEAGGLGENEGEIRKVDKEQGKLTIKHGPLTNLDMPPMTMVFRVQAASVLNEVAAGDRVNFKADKVNGVLTVTELSKQ